MSLFFFDFCQGDEISEDVHGLMLKDVERAYLEAYEAALEMWGDLLRKRQDPRRCSFRIRDARGAVLFTLPFGEALESCRDTVWYCAPITGTYHDSLRIVQRARQLSTEFRHEVDNTLRALREAKQLIASPVPHSDV